MINLYYCTQLQLKRRMNRYTALALAITVVCACGVAAAPVPRPSTAEQQLPGLLPGQQDTIKVAPCMAFRKSTNLTLLNNPIQCTVNPLYLVAKAYQMMTQANASSAAPRGYAPAAAGMVRTDLFPGGEMQSQYQVEVPKAFNMTLTRKALFRLAQKQQYCSKKTRTECIADTRTPCSWIDDDRLAYSMGLAGSQTSMAQCVYFTQSTFTRLLHWEMYQVEYKPTPGSLADALRCFWPPHKRETVYCSSNEVDAYCQKMPGCTAIRDHFRFSCQSPAALNKWTNYTGYSGDPFNATQHVYREAMRRMFSASAFDDIMNDAAQTWSNDSTTRFIYMFSGVNSLFEELFRDQVGLLNDTTPAWSTQEARLLENNTCSNFQTEEACLSGSAGNPHANHWYCSWSREQLVPGMSDANNPDFPPKKCQASPLARLEVATTLKDGQTYGESASARPAFYTAQDDLMAALMRNLYFTDDPTVGIKQSLCGDVNFCHVKANIVLPFPTWTPPVASRQAPEACNETTAENFVEE